MLLGGAGMLASWLKVPLDHLLLPLGLGLLAWRARRLAAARVILLWLLAALAAVSLWPPMRFERYYIPAIAPIAVAECLALASLLAVALREAPRALRALRARGGT
jgi:hypothetical protein